MHRDIYSLSLDAVVATLRQYRTTTSLDVAQIFFNLFLPRIKMDHEYGPNLVSPGDKPRRQHLKYFWSDYRKKPNVIEMGRGQFRLSIFP